MDDSGRMDGGFTYLEMLVVLVILTLGLRVGLPAMSGAQHSRAIQSAASSFIAKLSQTRTRAMTTGQPMALTIDPSSGSYQTDAGDTVRLPAGMGLDAANGPVLILFRPDGTATPSTINLRYGSAGARIGIDWLTGRASVAFTR
jgi:Tfp pilus assembly protein FimT